MNETPLSRNPSLTRAFRTRMLRDAAIFFGALILVLFALSRALAPNTFAITAFLLTIAAAITFNLRQRRAMKSYGTGATKR